MDPQVTFTWMMEAFRDGEREEACDHAANLLAWMDRGGFVPNLRITADDRQFFLISDALAFAFCRAACHAVLEPPPPHPPVP